jgi:hypothetical protein
MSLRKHSVIVNIDGAQQNSKSLLIGAKEGSAGYAGNYLAKGLIDEINLLYGSPKECEPEEISREQFEHLTGDGLCELIDMAAGRLIRDIAVHAEVLKMQLNSNPAPKCKTRTNQVKLTLLAKKQALDLESKDRSCGCDNKSDEDKLLAAIFSHNNDNELVSNLGDMINEWVVEDALEGVYDSGGFDVYVVKAGKG